MQKEAKVKRKNGFMLESLVGWKDKGGKSEARRSGWLWATIVVDKSGKSKPSLTDDRET